MLLARDSARIVGLVQARMGSRRLPGKVMLPLAGKPLLERLIERARTSRHLTALAVATSVETADDRIEELCTRLGVSCFRGSETDVLMRMLQAARLMRAGVIVRITGDNPLVGGDLIDYLIEGLLSSPTGLAYAHTAEETGFPPGLTVEAITMDALQSADASMHPADREHVTLFVRRQPEKYPTLGVKAPGVFPPEPLTVDTEPDYRRVKALFEKLYAENPCFGFQDVMVAVSSNHEVSG